MHAVAPTPPRLSARTAATPHPPEKAGTLIRCGMVAHPYLPGSSLPLLAPSHPWYEKQLAARPYSRHHVFVPCLLAALTFSQSWQQR